MSGVTYALCSAVAAAVTAILAKIGVEGVPSNLAYAIRTVSPIDKLSLPLTIILAALFLGESINWKLGIGVTLMTIGALLTIS
jgi:uncharacterized membrane protein